MANSKNKLDLDAVYEEIQEAFNEVLSVSEDMSYDGDDHYEYFCESPNNVYADCDDDEYDDDDITEADDDNYGIFILIHSKDYSDDNSVSVSIDTCSVAEAKHYFNGNGWRPNGWFEKTYTDTDNFSKEEFKKQIIDELRDGCSEYLKPEYLKQPQVPAATAISFDGMSFLFTGTLSNMKRADAEARVTSLGGTIAKSVTKTLSVLVATSNTSSKWKKAEELNANGSAKIELWTEETFMQKLAGCGSEAQEKSDEKKTDENLNEALFDAVRANDVNAVKSRINAGADVNAIDKDGKTPLLQRITKADVAKLLIDAGADVNAKSIERGWTPLHRCIDDDVAKLLINAGANVNAKDSDGNTPLHDSRSVGIANLLIGAGSDIHANNQNDQTPLHTCSDADIAKALIDAGANVNAKDHEGNTPLHSNWGAKIAKVLIDNGADVNAKNDEGQTPLNTNYDATTVALIKKAIAKLNEEEIAPKAPVKTDAVTAIINVCEKSYPDSLTQREIVDEIVKLGVQNNDSLATRVASILRKLVNENVLVRVDRIYYKIGSQPTEPPVNSEGTQNTAETVSMRNKVICLSGTFTYGKKADVLAKIAEFGGQGVDSLTKATDILLVGAKGSQAYAFDTYGSKYEKATKMNIPVYHESECDFDNGVIRVGKKS